MSSFSKTINSDEGRAIIKDRAKKLSLVEDKLDGLMECKYLHIKMSDNEVYGLSYEHLEEIRQDAKVTPVPSSKDYILGVTNWRGRVLPVVNLGKLLAIDVDVASLSAWLVIVNLENKYLGLMVNTVLGDENYVEGTLAKSFLEGSGSDNNFIQGVFEGKIGIINVSHIFKFCMLSKE